MQTPEGMVETAAAKKNDARFFVIKRLTASRCEYLLSLYIEIHA
jgi:hypothetical protein